MMVEIAIRHDELVTAIEAATTEVLATMLGLDAGQGSASREANARHRSFEVASFAGLTGGVCGTGGLVCAPELACLLSARFLMDEFPAVNEEVLDAFAELTNMVIGNVKNTLERSVGPMELSVPTVVYGRNLTSRTVGVREWTVVSFTIEGATLDVQLSVALPQAGRAVDAARRVTR